MVLFSNGYLSSIESELFSLVPTDWTRGVPTYVLTAKIYSPPPQAGVAFTPPEVVLNQIRLQLGFILDLIFTPDLDTVRALCRHKTQGSPDHPPLT
jgi:hypothetical protein